MYIIEYWPIRKTDPIFIGPFITQDAAQTYIDERLIVNEADDAIADIEELELPEDGSVKTDEST